MNTAFLFTFLAAFCPPGRETTGGMTDVMLLYVAPDRWPAEHLRPYVAWLDKRTGRPRDWFFDGWLFLMYGGAPSKHTYITGPTDQRDWLYFLDLLWRPGRCLDALNRCIGQVGDALGDRGKVFPVIIMIPYPSAKARNFGDVDGDGRREDLAKPADRLKTVRWFVDETLRRWRARKFARLRLWGFYWMAEHVPPADERFVQQACALVHARGYRMLWIPWYRAPGHEKWSALGFDCAVMQPNFAFLQPARGARLPNEDRLTDAANRARRLGMGVEMELNGRVARRWESRWNLTQYLNHGADALDGYLRGAVRAWYQGEGSIRELYESDNPACRRLYDDLYRFHKGTYRRRCVSLAEGRPCALTADAARRPDAEAARLVDGLWLTRGDRLDRVVALRARRVAARIDLGDVRLVEDVRAHLVGPEFPSAVRVRTAGADGEFRLAGESHERPATRAGERAAGFVCVSFPVRPARYVELELSADAPATLRLDEVVVPPAGHLLRDARGACSGRVERADPFALTDGELGPEAARWRGEGRVAFRLPQTRYARLLRAHLWFDGPAPAAQAVLNGRTIPLRGPRAGKTGWFEANLGAAPARALELRFRGSGLIACDEAQLLPAANLAEGKPYTLDPAFPAIYPDDGRELTDGALTRRGFGDGRTVGWHGTAVEVCFEWPAPVRVEGVRVFAQGGGYAGVRFPKRLTVAASLDGRRWTHAAAGRPALQVVSRRRVGGAWSELAWLVLRFPPRRARFVRLRFEGAGWTMLSEVQVLSNGENVAAGSGYALRPAPTSRVQYADNRALLTDGRYSVSGWRGCAGWHRGDPTITVDLQAPRRIAAVNARVVGGGAGAVFFPRRVDFYASLDGRSWRALGAARERPKEDGSSVTPGSMGLQPPRLVTARYVRVQLRRARGWAMCDEIEVFPAQPR